MIRIYYSCIVGQDSVKEQRSFRIDRKIDRNEKKIVEKEREKERDRERKGGGQREEQRIKINATGGKKIGKKKKEKRKL